MGNDLRYFEPTFYFCNRNPNSHTNRAIAENCQTIFWRLYHKDPRNPATLMSELWAAAQAVNSALGENILDLTNLEKLGKENKNRAGLLLKTNQYGLTVFQSLMIRTVGVLSWMQPTYSATTGFEHTNFLRELLDRSSRSIDRQNESFYQTLPFYLMLKNGLEEFLSSSQGTRNYFNLHRPGDQPLYTIRDMVKDISNHFLLPYAISTAITEGLLDETEVRKLPEEALDDIIDEINLGTYTTLLLACRFSWNGIIRLNNAWHRFQVPMRARPLLILERWHELFKPVRIGDYEILCITDSYQLEQEGRTMDHCVGSASYATSCAKGHCHIISIRRHHQGGFETLATLHLAAQSGRPAKFPWRLAEIRGKSNSAPPSDAVKVWEKFLSMVNAGTVEINRSSGSVLPESEKSKYSAMERMTHFPLSGDPNDLLTGYGELRIINSDRTFTSFVPNEGEYAYELFFNILKKACKHLTTRLSDTD